MVAGAAAEEAEELESRSPVRSFLGALPSDVDAAAAEAEESDLRFLSFLCFLSFLGLMRMVGAGRLEVAGLAAGASATSGEARLAVAESTLIAEDEEAADAPELALALASPLTSGSELTRPDRRSANTPCNQTTGKPSMSRSFPSMCEACTEGCTLNTCRSNSSCCLSADSASRLCCT